MTTWLHEQRLQAVYNAIMESGARRIIDLGCGEGDLFVRLAEDPQIEFILGIDQCDRSLETLRHRLDSLQGQTTAQVETRLGSITEPNPTIGQFDCAILIETVEHVAPEKLSALERTLFTDIRPGVVVMTTPNAEFNPLLGVPAHRFRHPGHRFEWNRAKFQHWAIGVASRAGYNVAFYDIGGFHPQLGGASQMARFQPPSPDRK